MSQRIKSRCLGTKRPFDTKAACEESIARTHMGFPLYAYLCDCGKWHKTKHSPEFWQELMSPPPQPIPVPPIPLSRTWWIGFWNFWSHVFKFRRGGIEG